MPRYVFSAEELELLGAIHERPLDDGRRLAYAEWLEREGNPLGEFIRLCLAWEKENPKYCCVNRGRPNEGIEGRIHRLLVDNRRKWLRTIPWPFRRDLGIDYAGCPMRKGLPIVNCYVTIGNFQEIFAKLGKWLDPRPQILLDVGISPEEDISPVLTHPLAARAYWLYVFGQPMPETRGRHYLRWSMPRVPITEAQVEQVAAWPRIAFLESIGFCGLTEQGTAIADQLIAPHVRTLVQQKDRMVPLAASR